MKNFKLALMMILVLVTLLCFASCGSQETPVEEPILEETEIVDPNIQVSSLFQTQYLMRDNNGNVIQHILMRTDTQELYIYDYFYDYDYRTNAYVFYDYKLTIKSTKCNEHLCTNGKDGVNGKSAYELAVENGFEGTLEDWLNSLVGAPGKDGMNGINGKDCQCTCKNDEVITPDHNTGPTWNESNPAGTIWAHDNYIKITQGELKEDLFGKYIEVIIENNSIYTIMVSTRDSSVNGYMYDFYFTSQVLPTKKAIEKFYLPDNDDLAELGCTELEIIEFTLVA